MAKYQNKKKKNCDFPKNMLSYNFFFLFVIINEQGNMQALVCEQRPPHDQKFC